MFNTLEGFVRFNESYYEMQKYKKVKGKPHIMFKCGQWIRLTFRESHVTLDLISVKETKPFFALSSS